MHLSAPALIAGVVLIAVGANLVIETASTLARRLGISELVVGLTVVAAGTSAPEFAVTILSALKGQGNISVGNVVGSNIFNLGFILGGCALARSIPVSRELVFRDGAALVGTTMLVIALVGFDLTLDRGDGALLCSLLVVYVVSLYRLRSSGLDSNSGPGERRSRASLDARILARLAAGFALLIVGAEILVVAATAIARSFGVSEWVIAVTIVAAGTSVPEFATSLAGVIRRRYSLSAGNLIGSDLFNMLGVLGVAGLIIPVSVDPAARFSLALLFGMVVVVLVFMRSEWRISRAEGLILVGISAGRWIFDYTVQSPP